ncbi:MAG TPA: PQQ-dependent sugar dehydrogenase [Gemmatimonadales bacterium]|nr:PQQ-dependent sugar dehydrogenase [Gemmatimonadales bacterium]
MPHTRRSTKSVPSGGWLVLLLGTAAAASGCGSESEPGIGQGTGARLEEIASGLSSPLYLTAPPGDPRLFIVQQTGVIRVVQDGALLPTPFLDLSNQVSVGGEQGLLGLAFYPDYATTGRFVVHYTDLAGDTQVSTFQVSADPNVADAGSEQLILTVDQPYPNHNGGQILFGPDGFLYLGLGDGGSANDPEGRGQNLSDLLGSILRLDVQAGTSYSVPADNPFVGQPDVRPEVWSYGLRNPWRFSFDRLTGDLYIADVGQQRLEEVNVATSLEGAGKGVNYGWSIMEGTECLGGGTCNRTGLTLPAFEYRHDQGCSITGGYVYRGTAIPALQGLYFFGDFCQGWVRSFRYTGGEAGELTDWPGLAPGGSINSFGEDASGELYLMGSAGTVYKVVPDP